MIKQIFPWIEKSLPNAIGAGPAQKINAFLVKLTADNASGTSARAALLVFAIRLLSAAIAFVLQILLARWMGSTQYGAFVLAWVVILLLGHLACMGLQTGIIKFITEYRAKLDKAHLRGALIAAPAISVCVSLLFALIGYFTLSYFGDSINKVYLMPFYLSLICLPMLAIEEVQDGIARSFDLPLTAFGPAFIIRPIVILGVMLIIFQSGTAATASTAIIAAIIATFVSTTLQSILLWRQVKTLIANEFAESDSQASNHPKRTRYQIKYWMSVAVPIFMAGGFYNLQTNIDIIFIGYFLDPQNVAVYFAAIKTLALVHFVHFAMRAASAHHFARYHSNNDSNGLAHYINKITLWTFWPTLVLALGMVLAGGFILNLFGADFANGQSLLGILAIGIVARASMGPAESLLSMTGHQNSSVLVLAITLICNLVLNIALIPLLGVVGAAIATTCAMIIETAALHVAVSRKLGIRVSVFSSRSRLVKGVGV